MKNNLKLAIVFIIVYIVLCIGIGFASNGYRNRINKNYHKKAVEEIDKRIKAKENLTIDGNVLLEYSRNNKDILIIVDGKKYEYSDIIKNSAEHFKYNDFEIMDYKNNTVILKKVEYSNQPSLDSLIKLNKILQYEKYITIIIILIVGASLFFLYEYIIKKYIYKSRVISII
jgi:hypothetical protein